MSGFELIAGVLGAAGTVVQTLGTLQAGREEQARYEYQQKVQEQQADEAFAAAQRDAQARYREGEFLLSQQRAGIAAGGGSVADASVIDLMSDTAAEVDLAARSDIYRGEQQARGYNDAAKIAGLDAQNAMSRARWQAAGGLFAGVSSMYSRFGQQARATAPSTGSNLVYG